MPTVVSRSAGANVEGASGNTIADTTTSDIPAGDKVFVTCGWFGTQTPTSVSGGGLTWSAARALSGGAAESLHTVIFTADAPAGLASGTSLTFTLSANPFARSIHIASCDGLVLEATGPDATAATAVASGANWTQNITTVATTTLVFGHVIVDASSGAIAPTGAGVTEAYEWHATDSNQQHEGVYLNATSAGVQTIGGTFTGTLDRAISAVSYATSAAAPSAPHRRSISHPGKTGPASIARFYKRPRVSRIAPPDVSGAYPVAVLADTPIWYGRLGDAQLVMTDVSGNARDGVYGVALIKGAAGALVGDLDTAVTTSGGATGTGDVAYASWMNGLTALSQECWVKFTSAGPSFPFSRTGNTGFNYGLSFNSAERAQFNVNASGGSLGVVGSTILNDGLWHHIVGVYDGVDLRLYVDGVIEGTPVAQTGTVNSATNGLQVGGRGANYFAGDVDEAALYGTALSPALVLAHFQVGTGVSNVTAVAATATAAAAPPVLTAGAVVTGVTATATATAQPPTVQAGATVTGVAATATATALPPTVTAGVDLSPPAATATATAPAPAVSNGAGGDVTVNAVTATATAAGVAPTVSAGATVAAVTASATGAAAAPVLTAGANVTAVAATSSAQAIAPAVSNGVGSNVNVNAVAATSSAAAAPPAVSAGAVVLAACGIATAAALAPAVSAAANVQATAALATTLALAPSVAAGVTLSPPVATATALLRPPGVNGAQVFSDLTASIDPPQYRAQADAPQYRPAADRPQYVSRP